eukprot:1141006-Pelagomonas_calceolata.AAC.4
MKAGCNHERNQLHETLDFVFTTQAEEGELRVQDMDQLHPFEFALEMLTGGRVWNGTHTRIKVNGTASVPGGPANRECGDVRPAPHLLGGERWSCVHTAAVWVDREHSGGFSKDSTQGGPIKLPAAGVKGTDLSLDVWAKGGMHSQRSDSLKHESRGLSCVVECGVWPKLHKTRSAPPGQKERKKDHACNYSACVKKKRP